MTRKVPRMLRRRNEQFHVRSARALCSWGWVRLARWEDRESASPRLAVSGPRSGWRRLGHLAAPSFKPWCGGAWACLCSDSKALAPKCAPIAEKCCKLISFYHAAGRLAKRTFNPSMFVLGSKDDEGFVILLVLQGGDAPYLVALAEARLWLTVGIAMTSGSQDRVRMGAKRDVLARAMRWKH